LTRAIRPENFIETGTQRFSHPA